MNEPNEPNECVPSVMASSQDRPILPVVPASQMDTDGLKGILGQAIGAASVCWEDPGRAGVFDSRRAGRILDELLVAVEKHVEYRMAIVAEAGSVQRHYEGRDL